MLLIIAFTIFIYARKRRGSEEENSPCDDFKPLPSLNSLSSVQSLNAFSKPKIGNGFSSVESLSNFSSTENLNSFSSKAVKKNSVPTAIPKKDSWSSFLKSQSTHLEKDSVGDVLAQRFP